MAVRKYQVDIYRISKIEAVVGSIVVGYIMVIGGQDNNEDN